MIIFQVHRITQFRENFSVKLLSPLESVRLNSLLRFHESLKLFVVISLSDFDHSRRKLKAFEGFNGA